MAEFHYCWRCATLKPMLDEVEWAQLNPDLFHWISKIRSETGCGLKEGRALAEAAICTEYRRLTGVDESNYLAVLHHRLAAFGPPCTQCGQLLRSPQASSCAACGAPAIA